MIKTSEVNTENNIETITKCIACGHICKQVYIVKDNVVKDMKKYGDEFIRTMDKAIYKTEDGTQGNTIYMCPECGILQTEVSKS